MKQPKLNLVTVGLEVEGHYSPALNTRLSSGTSAGTFAVPQALK